MSVVRYEATGSVVADRLFCSASGIDGPGQVNIQSGRIINVQAHDTNTDDQQRGPSEYIAGAVLLPGLIDLHAHAANGATASCFGVSPDQWMLPTGVTTVGSQGDAGADNYDEYESSTIIESTVRVKMALNLSRKGEVEPGSLSDPKNADIDSCVATAIANPRDVWGISVNASRHSCGDTDPREVLRRGLAVAEQTDLPLLYGMRQPEDWPLEEQLALLRPGDVVTYCFRRKPHCIVNLKSRTILPFVTEAQNRGVLFDVGHGCASFDFEVAEVAIGAGFIPNTISTDLQRGHLQLKNPVSLPGEVEAYHSLPLVISKLEAAGLKTEDAFMAATTTPSNVMDEPEIGKLRAGMAADLVLLKRTEEEVELSDPLGNTRSWRPWVARLVHIGRKKR